MGGGVLAAGVPARVPRGDTATAHPAANLRSRATGEDGGVGSTADALEHDAGRTKSAERLRPAACLPAERTTAAHLVAGILHGNSLPGCAGDCGPCPRRPAKALQHGKGMGEAPAARGQGKAVALAPVERSSMEQDARGWKTVWRGQARLRQFPREQAKSR